ncbi:hypothetical protein [Actinomadura kijaniata]|uniref:hypothetical protein n=1 Tax=Actinomadura kijaniata TaxID=46161 RepID=UPI000832580C|nr:hypothetical protein [Actinomadura kijaniata]
MSFQTSALVLSWVAIVLLSLVVAGLVRQVQVLSQGVRPGPGERDGAPRLGPPPGARAPAFDRVGPGLLLFLDVECGVCHEVLRAAEELGRPFGAVFAGPAPDAALAPGARVLTHEEGGLFVSYRVPATPFAVLVDAAGRVRRAEPVGSPEALRTFTEPEVVR